jgi:subtilisin family serine protease
MIRFAARPLPRLVLISTLLYCLVFAPHISLTPVRAERSVPAGKSNKTQSNSKARKQGEMLIKFRHGTPQQTKDQILGAFGKESKELRGRDKITKLKLKDGLDLDTQIGNVKQLSDAVEWAESNFVVSRSSVKLQAATPNDPLYSQQWALENSGQGGGAPGSDIGARAGWPTTTGSEKTIVAVIDTGVDTTHPDLKENLWVNNREEKGKKNQDDEGDGYVDDVYGWNFVNDSGDVTDDHGHGTAMAGIIAAQGNNGQGMSGVMWKASVMTLKALDSTGSGAISDVVEAMDFAATHGASVINCSFGTDAYSYALLDAIQRVSSYGVLVVASAGNDGRDITNNPYYPAGYTVGNLISVAATSNGDQLAAFSNWSPTLVQIAAPGVGVLTTAPGGQYVTATGTSASAPLVAGAAGLLKTLGAWMSAESVAKSLIDGARKSPHLYGKVATEGVVNLGESITIFQKIGEDEGPGGPGGPGNPGGPDAPRSPNGPGKPVGPGGPSNAINLDYIRNNRPKPGEGRVRVNVAPESPYNEEPAGSADITLKKA